MYACMYVCMRVDICAACGCGSADMLDVQASCHNVIQLCRKGGTLGRGKWIWHVTCGVSMICRDSAQKKSWIARVATNYNCNAATLWIMIATLCHTTLPYIYICIYIYTSDTCAQDHTQDTNAGCWLLAAGCRLAGCWLPTGWLAGWLAVLLYFFNSMTLPSVFWDLQK